MSNQGSPGARKSVYQVFVDDNWHFMDESERYHAGDYATADEAVAACRTIVDKALDDLREPGMSGQEVYERFKMAGPDPFVVPSDPAAPRIAFSAWEYARQRCSMEPPSPNVAT
jgi:CheY-like chemotaxis protein